MKNMKKLDVDCVNDKVGYDILEGNNLLKNSVNKITNIIEIKYIIHKNTIITTIRVKNKKRIIATQMNKNTFIPFGMPTLSPIWSDIMINPTRKKVKLFYKYIGKCIIEFESGSSSSSSSPSSSPSSSSSSSLHSPHSPPGPPPPHLANHLSDNMWTPSFVQNNSPLNSPPGTPPSANHLSANNLWLQSQLVNEPPTDPAILAAHRAMIERRFGHGDKTKKRKTKTRKTKKQVTRKRKY